MIALKNEKLCASFLSKNSSDFLPSICMSVERIGVTFLFFTRSNIADLASVADLPPLIKVSVSSSAPYSANSRQVEVISATRALFSSKARCTSA